MGGLLHWPGQRSTGGAHRVRGGVMARSRRDPATAGQARVFGDVLRRHREWAGLSQEQLAERAGLSVKAIGALERGERRRPYPHTLDLLAAALGLDGAE